MKEDFQHVGLEASVSNSGGAEEGAGAWGAESEALLASALEALRSPGAPPAARPDASALVARLAAALPARDTRFLDDYLRVLISHGDAEVKAITDELMRGVEGALAAGEAVPRAGADGVVLAGWLAAAAVWRAPRTPAAARALHQMSVELQPDQVEELARALHAALEARELLAAGEAVRAAAARGLDARGAALAGGALDALLLRAALAKLLS
ncbi:uncharacterized protein [Epargyreus clarus]|uniref:uncharacterized protein n=1 Tax=Epargyreus clarus TaxID=520877 RepID=UPI003C2C281F